MSDKVKRYDFTINKSILPLWDATKPRDISMEPDPEGRWVFYVDYEKTAEHLKEKDKRVERLEKLLDFMSPKCATCGKVSDRYYNKTVCALCQEQTLAELEKS